MTSTWLAALIVFVGCLTFAGGVACIWGIPVGLMVLGGMAIAAGVVVYDPAERRRDQ